MEAEIIKSLAKSRMLEAIELGNYKLAGKIITRAAELLDKTGRSDITWRTENIARVIKESVSSVDIPISIKPTFKL